MNIELLVDRQIFLEIFKYQI